MPNSVLGGGGAIALGMLLHRMDEEHIRSDAEKAMSQFGLDATKPGDVSAAQAYVLTKRQGMYFPSLNHEATRIENAAQAVMQYERTRPGTYDAAQAGDYAANRALLTLIDEAGSGMPDISEPLYRTGLVPALSTDSSRARRIVGPQAMQVWQAHHLIPFATVAKLDPITQRAMAAAGWVMDSPENLIAVPANEATFFMAPNDTFLPYQSGPHFGYDADVARLLATLQVAVLGKAIGGPEIKLALSTIEATQRSLIIARYYHNRIS